MTGFFHWEVGRFRGSILRLSESKAPAVLKALASHSARARFSLIS